MDTGKLILVALPLILLLTTAIFMLRRGKSPREKTVLVNSKRLRLVRDPVHQLACDVLVLENDSQLTFKPELARQAAEVGGDSIKRECGDWIAKYGPLLPGENAHTKGGLLGVKHIMHVVATQEPDLQFLQDLFIEELREAAQKSPSHTIALTLVGLSSGYVLEEYCSLLLKHCKALMESQDLAEVRELMLVSSDQRAFDLLAQGLN